MQDNSFIESHVFCKGFSNTPTPPPVAPTLRRSTRPHNKPAHLQQYLCNNVSWCNLVSFDTLPNFSKCSLASQSNWYEPQNYKEALQNPLWQKVMTLELNALHKINTWELVS